MKIIITFLTIFIVTSSVHAAFFTNSPSADSFVRSNVPTLNYGGAGSLSVSGSTATNGSGVINGASDSFIRFNTATMVASFDSLFGSGNWVISGVKLRVTEQGAPPSTTFNRGTGGFEILWIANDTWTEGTGTPMVPQTTGITYNSEPTLLNSGTDVSLGTFTNAGVDGALSLKLSLPTAFANDLQAGGEVGFYLTVIDSATGFTFYSRSFVTNSARPFLEISAVPRPGILSINLSETNVVLAATNGATGETYIALSSTNAALALNQWIPVATNVLNANGNFTIIATNAADMSSSPQRFFILQTQ